MMKMKKTKRNLLIAYKRFRLRFNSSASLIKRQSGTDKPSATESATFSEGFRSNRSIKEIILGAKSALSARDSCDNFWALRCFRTTMPKTFAKLFDRIWTRCQVAPRALQEQLFQFQYCNYSPRCLKRRRSATRI